MRDQQEIDLGALSWRPAMLLLNGLSCSLLLQPSARRSARPRMQAEAAAEVVGVSFEEAYSDSGLPAMRSRAAPSPKFDVVLQNNKRELSA